MVYYDNGEVLIRDMIPNDAPVITDEEIRQGWNQSVEKYMMRLEHQAQGRSFAITAEYRGNIAGYINVYLNADGGAFANRGIP